MIRSEILHAKAIKSSIDHQREISALTRIHEREAHHRSDVRRQEHAFWKEVARATSSKAERHREGASSLVSQPPLERAMDAHRLLREAKNSHDGVSRELCVQVSKVLRARLAADTFKNLQRREHIRCEHRRAEQSCEQLDEVGILRRFRSTGQIVMTIGSGSNELGDGAATTVPEHQCAQSNIFPPFKINREGTPPDTVSNNSPEPSPRLLDTIAVRSMQLDAHQASSTLTVHIEQAGSPVAFRLSSSNSGPVGVGPVEVVVGASHQHLFEGVESRRVAIAQKLSELGIKISRLEVRRDLDGANLIGRSWRRGRRNREELDENTIS